MPRTINEAAGDCRAAWKPYETSWEGIVAWCLHHKKRFEPLKASPEERITCILRDKDEWERIVRLDNFRPMLTVPEYIAQPLAELAQAQAELAQAQAECEKARDERTKARDEYNEAWAQYATSPECAAAHLADVPHHTWNGTSIF